MYTKGVPKEAQRGDFIIERGEDMDILVLGNGFDLEHELPTKYSDFLTFVTCFLELYQEEEIIHKSQFDSYLLNLCNHQDRKEVKLELFELVHKNIWINYFLEKQQEMGVNWIDFEKEISNAIQEMEYVISFIKHERDKDNKQIKIPHYICDSIRKLMPSMKEYISDTEQVLSHKQILLFDLNRMFRGLEIYLSDYVARIEIDVYNPDIFRLSPDYVLNFNYTSTYRNLYAKNDDLIEYDCVHGEANFHNTLSTCNMVLGIDEYLQEDEKNKNVEFIAFKKYFQRIKKKTGSLHRDWINEIKSNGNVKHQVTIFGHSLDITDKDILRDLIFNDNVMVTIYYYDEMAFGSQIANLVQIIGQEALIRRVHGKNANIVFKRQQPKRYIKESSFEVVADIKKLSKLHLYHDYEATAILHKVITNIENQNERYLVNPENIISLYDVLVQIRLDENHLQQLLLFAQKMIHSNCAYLQLPYSEGDWAYQHFDGSYECREKTRLFIHEINQMIMNTNDKVLVALQNSDELLECAASIDDEININDFDNAFSNAMNRFKLRQSNTNDIWKKLFYLSENVNRYDLMKYILKREEETKDTIELSRICYFKEVIQEREYNENQEEFEPEKEGKVQ